jgi:hypothetical protein
MEADWPGTENKVLFTAVEQHLKNFLMFFTLGKNYHDFGKMDKFKEIEIIFNNGNFFEQFTTR